jgi:hypothetical protein
MIATKMLIFRSLAIVLLLCLLFCQAEQSPNELTFHNTLNHHHSRQLGADDDSQRLEACQAVQNGQVLQTRQSMNVRFLYEVVTDMEALRVGYNIEKAVKGYLDLLFIISCNNEIAAVDWMSDIRAVSVGGSSVVSTGECTNITSEEGLTCYRMIGSNTVHLDDDAVVNLAVELSSISREIKTAFDSGKIILGPGDGVHGFHYVSAADDSFSTKPKESQENQTQEETDRPQDDQDKGARESGQKYHADDADNPLSNRVTLTGVVLFGIAGAGALIVLGYALTRRTSPGELNREELQFRDQVSLAIMSGEETSDSEEEEVKKRKATPGGDKSNLFAPRKGKTLA